MLEAIGRPLEAADAYQAIESEAPLTGSRIRLEHAIRQAVTDAVAARDNMAAERAGRRLVAVGAVGDGWVRLAVAMAHRAGGRRENALRELDPIAAAAGIEAAEAARLAGDIQLELGSQARALQAYGRALS